MSVSLVAWLGALPVLAGPISHAMELSEDGTVLFVDLEERRLLCLHEGQLRVLSELEGVVEGDALQNLIRTTSGELYVGQKKSIWMVTSEGEIEPAKPPAELKALFINRPGDLAPDGSVYVSRDFKNIQRSLPGGDAHPVLATDVISRIHSISVTPYGRIYFANNAEIAKLYTKGEVEVLQNLEGEKVLGLAAVGESTVLVLRQSDSAAPRLEHLDSFGNTKILVSAAQIAAVSKDSPVQIAPSD